MRFVRVRIISCLATVRRLLFGVSLLKSIWLNLVWLSCINFPGWRRCRRCRCWCKPDPTSRATSGNVPSYYLLLLLIWSLHSLLYQNQWCRCGVTSSRLRPPKNRWTLHGMMAMSTQSTGRTGSQPNGMWKTTIHLFTIGPVLENHPQHRFGGKIQKTREKCHSLSFAH